HVSGSFREHELEVGVVPQTQRHIEIVEVGELIIFRRSEAARNAFKQTLHLRHFITDESRHENVGDDFGYRAVGIADIKSIAMGQSVAKLMDGEDSIEGHVVEAPNVESRKFDKRIGHEDK